MRKKIKWLLIGLIIVILLITTSTPDVALRTAVFFHDPQSAFTMEYTEIRHEKNYTLYQIDKNVPYEAASGNPLFFWIVYHYGPFHLGLWNGNDR